MPKSRVYISEEISNIGPNIKTDASLKKTHKTQKTPTHKTLIDPPNINNQCHFLH